MAAPHRDQILDLLASPDADVVAQGCELIRALRSVPLLLDLGRGCYIDDDGGLYVGERLRARVRQKAFRGWAGVHVTVALIEAELRPRPTVLRTRYKFLGPRGAAALATTAALRALVTLDLRHSKIGDDGAVAIARSPHLGAVRRLCLQHSRIGPVGCAALADAAHLSGVTHLDLRHNPVGEGGARALAASPMLRRLRTLRLYGTDTTPAGARRIADAPGLPPHLRPMWEGRR